MFEAWEVLEEVGVLEEVEVLEEVLERVLPLGVRCQGVGGGELLLY